MGTHFFIFLSFIFYSYLLAMDELSIDNIYAHSWFNTLQCELKRTNHIINELNKEPKTWLTEKNINDEAQELVVSLKDSEIMKAFVEEPSHEKFVEYRKLIKSRVYQGRLMQRLFAKIPLPSTDDDLKICLKILCVADIQIQNWLKELEKQKS